MSRVDIFACGLRKAPIKPPKDGRKSQVQVRISKTACVSKQLTSSPPGVPKATSEEKLR